MSLTFYKKRNSKNIMVFISHVKEIYDKNSAKGGREEKEAYY